jgi:fumarate reductase subunit D
MIILSALTRVDSNLKRNFCLNLFQKLFIAGNILFEFIIVVLITIVLIIAVGIFQNQGYTLTIVSLSVSTYGLYLVINYVIFAIGKYLT